MEDWLLEKVEDSRVMGLDLEEAREMEMSFVDDEDVDRGGVPSSRFAEGMVSSVGGML